MEIDYHLDTSHVSKSDLDLINQCPAKYYARKLDHKSPLIIQKKSDALNFGGAYHAMMEDEASFSEHYFVMPNLSGTGSQLMKNELIDSNHGKSWITMNEYDKLRSMRSAIMRHPVASKMIRDAGIIEQRFNWIDPHTGVKCKIKPDKYLLSKEYAVDFKTSDDASPRGFGKSAMKYRYPVQGAFYTDGLRANGINAKGFIFIVQEKKYPYLVAVYYIKPEDIQIGRDMYMRNLETYAKCIESGQWPGYDDIISPLELPDSFYYSNQINQ